MSYKPSDSYSREFVTSNPTTGAAANADATPVATADFDGPGSGAMALTVTNLDTGRYKITGTIPGTRARGDVLNVSVAATVVGVAGKAIVDTQVLDSKRVGDLVDAPILTDFQQRGVAVSGVTAPVTVGTVSDKTGYSLAPTGLDSISVTAPTGPATTFPRMVVQLWRRFFAKSTLTATELKTYAADGTTIVTTQPVSDDGTTQTQGVAT